MKLTQSSGVIAFTTVANDEVLSAPTTPIKENLVIHEIEIGNSSGDDASCGWGYRLLDSEWKAGLWDDGAEPDYIDDTTDAQDVGADDFSIGSDTVDNDGFVIQADRTFNIVTLDVGTAEVGGTPEYEYTYWNGSSWAALTTLAEPNFAATGVQTLAFLLPNDWAALASGDDPVDTDELDAGKYAIRCRATTAPTTSAATVNEIEVVKLLDFIEKVADGNSSVKEYPAGKIVPAGRVVIPYCSTADASNWISIEYRKTT